MIGLKNNHLKYLLEFNFMNLSFTPIFNPITIIITTITTNSIIINYLDSHLERHLVFYQSYVYH